MRVRNASFPSSIIVSLGNMPAVWVAQHACDPVHWSWLAKRHVFHCFCSPSATYSMNGWFWVSYLNLFHFICPTFCFRFWTKPLPFLHLNLLRNSLKSSSNVPILSYPSSISFQHHRLAKLQSLDVGETIVKTHGSPWQFKILPPIPQLMTDDATI